MTREQIEKAIDELTTYRVGMSGCLVKKAGANIVLKDGVKAAILRGLPAEQPKILNIGTGNVLISPVTHADGRAGIAFSTQLGSGKVNQEHPTIRKGDTFNPAEHDVILNFANIESLDVLSWAVNEAKPQLASAEQPSEEPVWLCVCNWQGSAMEQDALGSKRGCCPVCGREDLTEIPCSDCQEAKPEPAEAEAEVSCSNCKFKPDCTYPETKFNGPCSAHTSKLGAKKFAKEFRKYIGLPARNEVELRALEACDHIEALEAQLTAAVRVNDELAEENKVLAKGMKSWQDKALQYLAALKLFGQHLSSCRLWANRGGSEVPARCTCGFEKAKKQRSNNVST